MINLIQKVGVVNKILQNYYYDFLLSGSIYRFAGTYKPVVIYSTSTQSLDYVLLKSAISYLDFTNIKNITDIGSGTGRVVAYLAWKYPHIKISGYEVNPQIVQSSRLNLKKFKNVDIENKNVLTEKFDSSEIYICFNPFEEKGLILFLKKISLLGKEFKLLYVNVPEGYIEHVEKVVVELGFVMSIYTITKNHLDIKNKKIAYITSSISSK